MGEVGLPEFKALWYGGILFYMILNFHDYRMYGECAYIDVVFQCVAIDDFDEQGNHRVYSFFRCFDDTDIVGCYSTSANPQCNSPALSIDGDGWNLTNDQLYDKWNGKFCTYGNGTNFTHSFPLIYDAEFSKQVGAADDFQCGTGYHISTLVTYTIFLMLIGIFLDEVWGVFDNDAIARYKCWHYMRSPTYIFTFTLLTVGNSMVIYTHHEWIMHPPQNYMSQGLNPIVDTPCKAPSRIAWLIIIVAALLIAVEIGEGIYNLKRYKKERAEGKPLVMQNDVG